MGKRPPPVDDIFLEQPTISLYQGVYPCLKIRSAQCFYWYASLRKCKVYLNALEEIEHFVSTSGSETWMTMGKNDCPVLVLQDTESKSGRWYSLHLGLHKCRLLLHWKDCLQAFVESEGTELPDSNVILPATDSPNRAVLDSAP